MFRGLSAANIDDKGRITVPANHRKVITEDADSTFVVTIDTEDRCLLLYPYPQWVAIEAKLEQLPSFHPASRRIQRLLIGHATEIELDSHGRVLLPPLLREYAQIDKTVMFVGQGKKIELWAESQWLSSRDSWLCDEIGGVTNAPEELLTLSL